MKIITKSIDTIISTNKASTSFLQRNFQIGYNKAARIMENLEQRGVVSEPNHAGKRNFNQKLINFSVNCFEIYLKFNFSLIKFLRFVK